MVIGTPGAFDPTRGQLRYARHLPGWHAPQLFDELRSALGVPLAAENDVNLAAVAEQRIGVAGDCRAFVLLWVAEAIGAAIVIDGRLHRGASGGAGEIAFLPLPDRTSPSPTRPSGTAGFQQLAGAHHILSLAQAHGIAAATAAEALTVAGRTPGIGDTVLTEVARRLALGLAALVTVLDPELVVLAGGLIAAGGQRLYSLIRQELRDLAVPRPRLRLTGVTEDPVLHGAVHTALMAARNEVFDTARTIDADRRTR